MCSKTFYIRQNSLVFNLVFSVERNRYRNGSKLSYNICHKLTKRKKKTDFYTKLKRIKWRSSYGKDCLMNFNYKQWIRRQWSRITHSDPLKTHRKQNLLSYHKHTQHRCSNLCVRQLWQKKLQLEMTQKTSDGF